MTDTIKLPCLDCIRDTEVSRDDRRCDHCGSRVSEQRIKAAEPARGRKP